MLSIESDRIERQNLIQPWLIDRVLQRGTSFVTRRVDRAIIYLHKVERTAMHAFTSKAGCSSEQHSDLLCCMAGHVLLDVFQISSVQSITNAGITTFRCASTTRVFFRSLSKVVAPASGMMPSFVWEPIRRFLEDSEAPRLSNSTQEQQQQAQQLSHIIYEQAFNSAVLYAPLIVKLLILFKSIPCQGDAVLKLIHYILDIAVFTLNTTSDGVSEIIRRDTTSQPVDPTREMLTTGTSTFFSTADHLILITGAMFPGREYIREVKSDQFNFAKNITSCTKHYQHKSRLGPGIILYWCANHRICLGFSILSNAESCEMVFTTIVTRFPVIPEVIVYDNACNLSEYCLNRNPALFKSTTFLCDAFHYQGHVNCSHSFNSALSGVMSGLPSVLHEQKNSILAKNKISSIFMRFDTFAYMIKGLVSLLNHEQKKKLLEEDPRCGIIV